MSTVLTSPEAAAKVRHPLDAVRAHIRKYVLLETGAAVVLFLAAWFWIGLLLDFGTFWTTAYDWILELNFIDVGGQAARGIRIGILACIGIGLGYLIFSKLITRFWKEFSDPAVALVLERRFPRELGDRLITAVELADAKKAEGYGFSGPMLAKTINEAADRVAQLPVEQVFDWARLRRLWLMAGAATLGVLLFAVAGSFGLQKALARETGPADSLWQLKDTASIWFERNLLLQDSYWLRNSQIEIVRFQDNARHPGEMRVGRDEQRPDLVVRALEWVVPDANGVGGWGPLKVADTGNFASPELLAAIKIPSNWPGWIIDLDDLDPSIPTGAVPTTWQGRSAGEVAKELAGDATLQAALEKAGATKAVASLSDWKTWTFDKLRLQLEKPEVQKQLAVDVPDAIDAVAELTAALETQAARPSMNRRLRRLATPTEVTAVFRGASTRTTAPGATQADRKFSFNLADLKESVTFFVRGGDSFTPPLRITLAPPPAIREISITKEEPAYLYHWVAGPQAPLRGKRQLFENVKISVTGETSVIDVPLGTTLTLNAVVDRPLKEGIQIRPVGTLREAGVMVPDLPVTRDSNGESFSVKFDNVDKTMEFQFEFHDEDNVRGRRRMRIRPIDDQAPEILNFELGVVLRKPRFKEGLNKSLSAAAATDSLLITPDAVLPFAGTVRDDVALTDVRWVFETQPITIEAGIGKDPGRVILQGTPGLRRASVIMSMLRFAPPATFDRLASPTYFDFMGKIISLDLKQKQVDPESSAPLATFVEALKSIPEEEDPAKLAAILRDRPAKKPFVRELVLRDRESFGVKQLLPDLKTKDANSQAMIFHLLKLSVAATDNNVETGPSTSKTRTPIAFLVVPETELLGQIGLEEEVLRERLEKVIAKLKTAQTTMSAQGPILRSMNPETDFSLVALRVDEVRKALLDGGSATREIFADYSRILQELQVNRVKRDKISDVDVKIVRPLELIVNPNLGSFALADDAVARLAQNLDDDISSKQVLKNSAKHLGAVTQADDQLLTLIDQLNAIYLAIDRGLDFNSLLQAAIAIGQGHEHVVSPLRQYRDQILGDLIRELTDPKK